jgi:hypothetical protein
MLSKNTLGGLAARPSHSHIASSLASSLCADLRVCMSASVCSKVHRLWLQRARSIRRRAGPASIRPARAHTHTRFAGGASDRAVGMGSSGSGSGSEGFGFRVEGMGSSGSAGV